MAVAVATYLWFELFFRGLFASERFFRHLPDFVLSRSFDHLPSLTLGTGTVFTLMCLLCLFQICLTIETLYLRLL